MPPYLATEYVRIMTQHAVIVTTGPEGHTGLEKLNVKLERGWTVAEVTAMGGAGTTADAPTHAALVILERRSPNRPAPAAAVAALEQVGEESEEVVEQVMEEAEDVIDGNESNPSS